MGNLCSTSGFVDSTDVCIRFSTFNLLIGLSLNQLIKLSDFSLVELMSNPSKFRIFVIQLMGYRETKAGINPNDFAPFVSIILLALSSGHFLKSKLVLSSDLKIVFELLQEA